MKDRLCQALPHRDTPFFRALHISVAILVLLQIINSDFTESEALGEVNLAEARFSRHGCRFQDADFITSS